jgi:transposase
MTFPDVAWIGVDVGKVSHHVTAIDAEGRVLWSQQVANDQEAIEQIVQKATRTAARVQWAVDLTAAEAALLLALLVTAVQPVVYVPGRVVNRMTGAFGEGKTDARDARVIAETARLRRDLNEIRTPDELVVELALLTAYRIDLMADWVRGIGRLRDLLTRIFPGLERAFDYSNRIPLILVSGFCTPASIRQAGEQGLTEHLRSHRAHRASIPATVRKRWPPPRRRPSPFPAKRRPRP